MLPHYAQQLILGGNYCFIQACPRINSRLEWLLRRGFTSLAAAVEDALGALAACRAPAQSSAPQLQIVRETVQHLPDREGWQATMTSVHSRLSETSSVGLVCPVLITCGVSYPSSS